MAIIPQDPLLFSGSYIRIRYITLHLKASINTGTLRSNLDPFGLYDDAALWDALKRSYLVEPDKNKEHSIELDGESSPGTQTPVNQFNLDTVIEDEGNNLSVGQVSCTKPRSG